MGEIESMNLGDVIYTVVFLPVWYLMAGGIVSVKRYGNTDAPRWRRVLVGVAWPFFVRDFRL